jgi:uncharacterized protein (TIGR02466 family)
MPKLLNLFPTPLLKIDRLLKPEMLETFTHRAQAVQKELNSASELLTHTQMINPEADPISNHLSRLVEPHLVAFGELLFADKLHWTIKEIWLNVLETGGSQFMHTHANSFISGIVYITKPHASANTVFRKTTGGGEFIFKNDVPLGHYSSDTWIMSEIEPGDMVLYPSHLMHGVPPNEGKQRITIAFNAIPHQLDSLGYKIQFQP